MYWWYISKRLSIRSRSPRIIIPLWFHYLSRFAEALFQLIIIMTKRQSICFYLFTFSIDIILVHVHGILWTTHRCEMYLLFKCNILRLLSLNKLEIRIEEQHLSTTPNLYNILCVHIVFYCWPYLSYILEFNQTIFICLLLHAYFSIWHWRMASYK